MGYQKAGIKYAADREGTLLADEMGLGKTIQAIGLINIRPEIHRVLIIVPAHLKIKWSRELRKWLVRPQSVGIADGSCFPSTDIVIINFQILNKFPKRLEFYWDLVVVDEAHTAVQWGDNFRSKGKEGGYADDFGHPSQATNAFDRHAGSE